LAAGRSLPGLRVAPTTGPQVTRTVTSMAIFGAAYAVASLSCTIGPFLAIVVASFRAGSPAEGVGLFVAYAAGMGLAVAAAALAVALAHRTMIVRWRRLAPTVSRLGGLLLLLAGGYVAYYGWWEIRVLGGGATADPVIDAAGAVQRWLDSSLDHVGPAVVALVVATLAAGGLVAAWFAARRGRPRLDR